MDRKLREWIAIAEVDLKTDFKERFEPSKLTTSRVNEHERLGTSHKVKGDGSSKVNCNHKGGPCKNMQKFFQGDVY